MSNEENVGLKVKDRRRFDSSGNEREGEEQVHPSAVVAAAPTAPVVETPPVSQSINQDANEGVLVDSDVDDDEDSDEETGEIEFSAFVMSLATQALMQLGVMQPPAGVQLPVDRESAKQTIEILTMLKYKTKGNLDQAETKLFEEILHSLRISYVRGPPA